MPQRRGRRDEGVVVAAERAVVFAGQPLIELGPEQGERERQAHAGQRFRHGDDVGREAHALEAEEAAGAAAAGLDIVDDQQRAVTLGNVGDRAQPFRRRGIEPAFALHRLDENAAGASSPLDGSDSRCSSSAAVSTSGP